jgi:Cof subfamily protein (haloacid dehalogenase superfamily)
MVKMIVMDLDGTLLTDDKNISDYTLSILEKSKKKGIKIVIATARSERSAKKFIEIVKPDIVILNGGALVINKDGETLFKKFLSEKTSDGIINECIRNENVSKLVVHAEKNSYVNFDDPQRKYNNFLEPLRQRTYKISVKSSSKKEMEKIKNKFIECELINYFNEDYYTFTHKEAKKMDAIKEISKKENIRIYEIIAFGDDYNDMEMIKGCGVGIAMENGIKEIKEIAKYVCRNNNEDGVGKWIEENILE